jgi:hypothetical protein
MGNTKHPQRKSMDKNHIRRTLFAEATCARAQRIGAKLAE